MTFATRLSTRQLNIIEYLANRPGDEALLTATYPGYLVEIKAAAEEIGVNNLVPSEVRHSGASVEVGLGPGSLADGQKKGRWASTAILKRDEKCGELNEQIFSDIQQRHIRGMRGRSQRCSVRRQASCRNGEPLCGWLGTFTDEISVHCGGKLLQTQTPVAAVQWVPVATWPKISPQNDTGER